MSFKTFIGLGCMEGFVDTWNVVFLALANPEVRQDDYLGGPTSMRIVENEGLVVDFS